MQATWIAIQAGVHLQDEGVPLPLISIKPIRADPVNGVKRGTISYSPFFSPTKNRDEHLDAIIMVTPKKHDEEHWAGRAVAAGNQYSQR